ncbi:phosphoglycolate phosphatase [Thaumasiovibrio subtropicus]|uniref:phosphoglycolate phosphatase n=1 Tax=Thaumasiovibrio subtropicus TaxID=1891207 RepID=UPI000B34C7F9|nr:phosphoglycolate phosphatase [Thaumasiovibrio subtropicus]
MQFEGIRLIAFDLDGTLLDSVPDLAVGLDRALRAFDMPGATIEQVKTWIGNGADVLVARGMSQSLTPSDDLDPKVHAQVRARFDQEYEATGHTGSELYAGVKETLSQLHAAGYTMALVTNKPSQFVPHVLEQQGIKHFFSDIIGGDTFPVKKPDPTALNWLLDKHQLSAKEMLMVGDSKNDILAAKNAGCPVVGLTYGYNHGEPIALSEPNIVLEHFSQLRDTVKLEREYNMG